MISKLSALLVVTVLAIFWLIIADNIWMFSLFAVAYGFTYGGTVPQWAALVGDLYGISAIGRILGPLLFFATLFGASGPILFGYVFDVAGSYTIAFIIGAILS